MLAPQQAQEGVKTARFRNVLDHEFSELKDRLLHEFEQLQTLVSSTGYADLSERQSLKDFVTFAASDIFDESTLTILPRGALNNSSGLQLATLRPTPQEVFTPRTEFATTPEPSLPKKNWPSGQPPARTPITPRDAAVITPRSGPRIEAGHLETVLSADTGGSVLEADDLLDAAMRKSEARKTEVPRLTPLERWRQLGLALMSPRARLCLSGTTYYMHDCWSQYWGMLRRNDKNCKKELTSAMGKVLRGRQGLLASSTNQSTQSFFATSDIVFNTIIHPDSITRMAWVICAFIVLAYDTITLPIYVFFEFDDGGVLIIKWVAASFWCCDILVSFISGRYMKGILELRSAVIARSYLRSWFPFDVTLVVLDLTTAFIDTVSEAEGNSATFISAIKVFRVLRLLRLLRLIKTQTIVRRAFAINNKGTIVVSGLLRITFVFGIYCHLVACVWYGIGRIDDRGWGTICRSEASALIHCYFRGAQWALTQPFCGASLIAYTTTLEWIFSTASLFVVLTFIAILLGKTAETVMHFTATSKVEMRQDCVEYSRRHTIPTELSHRFIRYVDASDLQVDLGQQLRRENEILQILPLSMQMELLEEARKPYLMQVNVINDLKHASPKLLKQLCAEATVSRMSPNGEAVFTSGDSGTHWRICEFGSLVYISGLDFWMDFAMVTTTAGMFQPLRSTSDPKACWSCDAPVDSGAGFCPSCSAVQFQQQVSIGNAKRPSQYSVSSEKKRPSQRRNSLTPLLHSATAPSTASLETWDASGAGSEGGCSAVAKGQSISEMVLWTSWVHTGDLIATSDSVLLELSFEDFSSVMKARVDTCLLAARYAQQFVKEMSSIAGGISDLHKFALSEIDEDNAATNHMVFLSHYKAEAGTEATLMMEGIQMLLEREVGSIDEGAVFLDSEDLTDLTTLKDHVGSSNNLVFLLTPGVLLRPWCLVEIVTAMDNGVQIVPVEIQRPGLKFAYPSEEFYTRLLNGKCLDSQDERMLLNEGITMEMIVNALQFVFMQIALPFSPHKSKGVREAELMDIMQRCRLLKNSGVGLHRQKTVGTDEAPSSVKSHRTRSDRATINTVSTTRETVGGRFEHGTRSSSLQDMTSISASGCASRTNSRLDASII